MAVTVSSIYEESMGSNTLYILNLASFGTDTYTNASLGPQVIGYWANSTSAGCGVSLTSSTGVFTLTQNITGTATLYIVAKQV